MKYQPPHTRLFRAVRRRAKASVRVCVFLWRSSRRGSRPACTTKGDKHREGGGGGGHDIRWTAWLFQTAHARHAIPPWPLQYLPWLKRGAVSCTGRLCVVCPQPPLPQQRLQNLCSGHQLAPHLHRRVSSCQWGAVTEPPQLRGAGATAEASRVQNMVLGGVRVY